MNKLLLTYLLIFPVLVLAQSDTLNRIDDDGNKVGYWIIYGHMKPEKGYPADGRIEEGYYVNDKKEGQWIKYHKDGETPRLIGEYKKNRPAGNYTKIGSNGIRTETGRYIERNRQGEFKRYSDCGKLITEKFFNEKGYEEGWTIYYYESCQCSDSTELPIEYMVKKVNGLSVDTAYRYYPNGCLQYALIFNDDGTIQSKEEFDDDCEVDSSSVYMRCLDQNLNSGQGKGGPTLPPLEHKEFDRDGFNRIFNDNDDLWMEGHFKDGKLYDGKLYKYDSDGVLLKIEIWKSGKYNKEASDEIEEENEEQLSPCDPKYQYDEDGELIWDGKCKDGKPWDGKKYIYDADGILLKIEIWKNGKYHSDGRL